MDEFHSKSTDTYQSHQITTGTTKTKIVTNLTQIGCLANITAIAPPKNTNGARKEPRIGNTNGVKIPNNMERIPILKLVYAIFIQSLFSFSGPIFVLFPKSLIFNQR